MGIEDEQRIADHFIDVIENQLKLEKDDYIKITCKGSTQFGRYRTHDNKGIFLFNKIRGVATYGVDNWNHFIRYSDIREIERSKGK